MKLILIVSLLIAVLLNNINAGEWKNAEPLLSPRGGASALTWDNFVYVFGGKSTANKVLNSVERLDLSTGKWDSTAVPKFQTARYNAYVIEHNGLFYLIGGRNNEQTLESCEIFDPVQNLWLPAHDLRSEREGMIAIHFNNKIYIIGGQEKDHMIEEIEWYNIEDDEWEEAEFDFSYPRSAFFYGQYEDTLYTFGGNNFGLTKDIFQAIPIDSSYYWEQIGELESSRAYGASVTMNGQVYLIGGETYQGKTDKVEVFNFNSKEMTAINQLSSPRSGLAAVLINDTTIIAIGGFEGANNFPIPTVEIYGGAITSIRNQPRSILPEQSVLMSSYPNPFNSQITIEMRIPQSGAYSLDLFNMSGQRIEQLGQEVFSAGTHQLRWQSPGHLSSGIYFLTIQGGGQFQKLKIVYVK